MVGGVSGSQRRARVGPCSAAPTTGSHTGALGSSSGSAADCSFRRRPSLAGSRWGFSWWGPCHPWTGTWTESLELRPPGLRCGRTASVASLLLNQGPLPAPKRSASGAVLGPGGCWWSQSPPEGEKTAQPGRTGRLRSAPCPGLPLPRAAARPRRKVLTAASASYTMRCTAGVWAGSGFKINVFI